MTEAEAQQNGYRAAYGKSCGGSVSGNLESAVPDTAPPMRALPTPPATKETLAVKVWVNTSSRVYHCPGTRYYGNTARGSYMTEAEAQQNGYRAAYGRSCS